MRSLRAHLSQRAAANPLGLRFRFRQYDLVQLHGFTVVYHAEIKFCQAPRFAGPLPV
jgi:hypothetical protein